MAADDDGFTHAIQTFLAVETWQGYFGYPAHMLVYREAVSTNAAPSRSEPFEFSTRPHKPSGWWLCRAAAEDICINGKPAAKLGVVELENV